MARTKRTIQASPPASSTTEQEPDRNGQDENIPSISGEETTINATESKDFGGNNVDATLDKGLNKNTEAEAMTEDGEKPAAGLESTYTFKRPLGITQEQMDYKVFKIQSMFGYLTMDETHMMLEDCFYNEDEVTVRLITQNDYLSRIQAMLKTPPNVSPTPSSDATSTSSADSPTACQQSTSFVLQPHVTQQQVHYYQPPPQIHDLSQYQQDQDSTTISAVPSQDCMSPYQVQYPYYRPLQPLPPFPMSVPESSTNTTTITSTSTSATTTATEAATATPKRGSNYGKKYKKRKPTNPLPPVPLPSMDDFESMPPGPIPSSSEVPLNEPGERRRVRSVGRLALDDAIQQVRNNPTEQEQAFVGWSAARIRAYGLIDANPNTYYYRFNSPGEEQRKGAWTPEEKELFLNRVQEVGANSQWGVFSRVIPGRVGYQCSNFYRLLIETGELFDSNYVVDERGKAHYLFDKKTATGEIQKTIRNHYKHKKNRNTEDVPAAPKKPKIAKKKKPKKKNPWDTDDDDDDDDDEDGDYSGKSSKAKKTGKRRSTRRSTGDE